jgi:nicotinamidase/pyrazinamidase
VQNDFCEGGSLAVSNASEIIPIINTLKTNPIFDEVILTQDYHPKVISLPNYQISFLEFLK